MRFKLLAGFFSFTIPLMAAGPTTVPTFNKDIAPILYQNCATCHHPGEVAPFSLLSYSDAKRYAPVIADATSKHIMPPWKAEPGFGDFADARVLKTSQIATLKDWAAAGAPELRRRRARVRLPECCVSAFFRSRGELRPYPAPLRPVRRRRLDIHEIPVVHAIGEKTMNAVREELVNDFLGHVRPP